MESDQLGLAEADVRVVEVAAPEAASEAPAKVERRSSSTDLKVRLINLIAVGTPFLGFIAAIVLLWGVAFNWSYLVILTVMYLATGFGITVGYHRLFTHRSFTAPRPVVAILGVLGSMALEGPILQWVAVHRRHHQHSDEEHDPHSPHNHDGTLKNVLKGMWHAHVGWMLASPPRGLGKHVRDLRSDPLVRRLSQLFPLWVLIGLVIPAVAGGLMTMSWTGVLLGFLWGGLARIFLVHHVTWSINSVCHIWGARTYECDDHSRNNPIFGVLGLGEGWHNNHHAFPTSARHGLQWWQVDFSYMIIRAMSVVGLARDVRTPTRERMDAKRRTR